jgi:hypothetical protein
LLLTAVTQQARNSVFLSPYQGTTLLHKVAFLILALPIAGLKTTIGGAKRIAEDGYWFREHS